MVFKDGDGGRFTSEWLLRFCYVPIGISAMGLLIFELPSSHWGWVVLWTVVVTYGFFCVTSCFHETGHMTLLNSEPFSKYLGRVLGTIILTPYTAYRETHIRHHAYLNTPADWELWPYSDPQRSLVFRRCFVWIDLAAAILTTPFIYGRIFFHKESPLSHKARKAILLEYFAIVLFWGSVISLVGWTEQWAMFFKVWLVPHILASVIQAMRKLTEHLGMSSYDPLLGTRTVIGTSLLTKIATFLNFDIFIHGPHHRHPRLQHLELAEKMQTYVKKEPERAWPIFPSYTHAIIHTLPHLVVNPGVGVNAGAAAPPEGTRREIKDFVSDVSAEVLASPEVP